MNYLVRHRSWPYSGKHLHFILTIVIVFRRMEFDSFESDVCQNLQNQRKMHSLQSSLISLGLSPKSYMHPSPPSYMSFAPPVLFALV
jgi:hypothetical protein